ncbi:MAG: gluconate 2-dehydrogenase subunit 3 family protein [Blastocatellales bacterium]|nr:gluconate 2-dehydrogenase subunit 3 family protein [Blastocatellales bacterium]
MSDEKTGLSRREAIKGLAVGIGTAGSLPILHQNVLAGQDHARHTQAGQAAAKKVEPPKLFNTGQMALIATISELIIPTDDHSPGAIAAEVPAFIDLMISESPAETKKLWTDGLDAMDHMSREKFQVEFNKATSAQQTEILTAISRNERTPQTLEERFFRAIKNLTIDGYYTSEIGIHKELQYKGNTYLKEFKGCTHPEHING